MTKAHTMSPGRIVHYFYGGSCTPAVLEDFVESTDDAVAAKLVPITLALGSGRSTAAVKRQKPGAGEVQRESWHWTDECPFVWPETD